MRELELKAVVPDLEQTRSRVKHRGAVSRETGVLHDWRYDTQDRALRARDVVLRVRDFQGTPRNYTSLDWKGPAQFTSGYKERDEVTLGVVDAAAAARILRELGFVVTFEIERSIEVYHLDGATIRFERYARMDTLVEVEGEPAAIEHAIAALGLPRAEFTTGRLADFALAFEQRTGARAALSSSELSAGGMFAREDA
jgi:predicted adenylyl cyclase CyaB